MTPIPTDQQLLTSYLQGSQDAFRTLVDRYAGLVFSTASRIAPPALAEDITQAVFILLANRAHTLRNPQLLPAWLLKVTHFCAADARRAAQRRKNHEQKAAAMATPFTTNPPIPDPLEPHLDAALQSLSPPDRTALLLRFYNDHSLSQIAASLSISEEAAKKRVARALQKLRKLFLHQGTTLALPLLAATLAKQSSAAPPALITKITATALAKSATTTSATLIAKGALKLMAYTTAKWTAAATAAAILITITTTELVRTRPTPPLPTPLADAAVLVLVDPAPTPITSTPSSFSQLPPAGPAPTIEVLDFLTHQPLAGVQVELSTGQRGTLSNFATTNSNGTASLPLPATFDNSLVVIARKEGFVPAETYSDQNFPNDPLPTKISLQLEKATTIGGRVLDDQGTPLASALVQVIVMKQYKDLNQNIPWDLHTTTNAQGEWTLNAIPEQCDKIQVGAFHKSCISFGFIGGPETSIAALRNRTAITTLKHGTPIHALVRGPDGKPRKAWIGIGDQRIGSNAVPEFPTSDDGQFDIVPDPTAPLYLAVRADGCAPTVARYEPADPQPLIITLEPPTPLTSRILDANGHPIPNATLTLDYVLDYFKSEPARSTRAFDRTFISDTNGRISWPNSLNTQLFVTISAYGYLTQEDTPLDPGQTNDITLLPRFVVHAIVIDDDTHLPAKNFRVVEGNFDSPDHKNIRYTDYPEWPSTHIRTTGPGTFDFSDPNRQDSFVLRILDGDYEPTNSPLITTDGHDQSLTIHVHKGQRLAGTLLDTEGNPLPKTYVYLQTTGLDIYDAHLPDKPTIQPGFDNSAYFALTDSNGNFSFPPQNGHFTLIASNDSGYAITRSKTFNQSNTLQLTPWAKIEGTLVNNGHPAPNAPVSANYDLPYLRDESDPYFDFQISATTNTNGHFSIPKIFAGPISLGAKTITTKPGHTSTITLETTTP